jgi:hypothetical protein
MSRYNMKDPEDVKRWKAHVEAEAAKAAQKAKSSAEPPSENFDAEALIKLRGRPAPLLANCISVFQQHPQWLGPKGEPILEFDDFRRRVCCRLFPPAFGSEPVLRWSDQHDRLATEWIQREVGIFAGQELVGAAIQTVAQKRPFHPVREYLNALKWDREPRIDTWLSRYLGVAENTYSKAVGAAWLISAVARVMKPGTKVDTALILEGKQGIGKSSALRILGGEWFTDDLADMGSKDSKMQSMGAWIIELAELSSMTRSEVERVKNFMGMEVDSFRPPYGRNTIDVPRQCVYAGSTNRDDYLLDQTGNRRFWPVHCAGAFDLQHLRADGHAVGGSNAAIQGQGNLVAHRRGAGTIRSGGSPTRIAGGLAGKDRRMAGHAGSNHHERDP